VAGFRVSIASQAIPARPQQHELRYKRRMCYTAACAMSASEDIPHCAYTYNGCAGVAAPQQRFSTIARL
jgi:hypothetical protein